MRIDPSARVHPGAIVEEGARLGPGVTIGPFALIGPEVTLAAGVEVKSHAVVTGRTEVGEDTVIFPFAVVGEVPQDLKYKGERTRLVIGRRNRIREGATLNLGTEGGGGVTRVGDDCLFMTGAHVGHDAQVGNRVVMANQAALAGHCVVGDDVILGGLVGVHQFVRIGRGAMIGALTMVTGDVIPFGMVQGPRGRLEGLNLIGLKRRQIGRDELSALRAAYRHLKGEGGEGDAQFLDRVRHLGADTSSPHVQEIVAFLLSPGSRPFLPPT